MINSRFLSSGTLALLLACATTRAHAHEQDDAAAALRAAETAFADAMARRDLEAFASFVADDAVFINNGNPLRGKAAVVAHWKRFFEKPAAPFSWKPELVEVTGGGTLGYSEGPVASPSGKVSSRYSSTWRLDPAHGWKVVFDNGYPVCDCPKP